MSGRGGRRYMKAEDFDEGDVWGVMEERENPNPSPRSNFKPMTMMMRDHYSPASSSPRMIPKSSSSSSSSSSYMNEDCCNKQFSAPLDIPDWSKIYSNYSSKSKKKSMDVISPSSSSSPWVDFGSHDDDDGHGDGDGDGDDDDGDGDDDDGMIPPHEFLARKLARTQISSFSVCEGIGRTLKGRDLRKVRNAILTRTGFLE